MGASKSTAGGSSKSTQGSLKKKSCVAGDKVLEALAEIDPKLAVELSVNCGPCPPSKFTAHSQRRLRVVPTPGRARPQNCPSQMPKTQTSCSAESSGGEALIGTPRFGRALVRSDAKDFSRQ